MSDAELVNGNKIPAPSAEQLLALEEEERLEEEKQQIDKNPPIVFSDAIDVSQYKFRLEEPFLTFDPIG